MKERPILFSAPMVRAILEGRKTQTRRVVKYIPVLGHPEQWCQDYANDSASSVAMLGSYRNFCPYGITGDRLWVRETHGFGYTYGGEFAAVFYKADSSCALRTDDGFSVEPYGGGIPENPKWKPSIHMPRWASRITLEITGVRVERLNDISEEDAKAEGAEMNYDGPYSFSQGFNHRGGFMQLWESINGAGSWQQNPWVWVIEFKKL